MELRGARGISRLAFKAPTGTAQPGPLLNEVKSGAAELGALDALVGLLKRAGAR
jgi:hypothetical protein